MAKISVIIPIYNVAQYLPKCLESVCNQTLQDIEIICIDDCSSDGSLLILQEYAKNDKRIKLIELAQRKGAGAARNIGIKNSCGQYLGFVDGDDFIDKNFYKKLHEVALETNANAVKGNLMTYCPKTKLAKKESWIDLNDKVRRHKSNFYFSFTSAIYEASFIKENSVEFLEGLIHFEDPYFTIKAAVFYERLEVVDDIFYYYVSNPDSASRKKLTIHHIDSLALGVDKVLDIFDQYSLDKIHYINVFNFLLEQVLCWCNRVDVGDEINLKAVKTLFNLYRRCSYKEECAAYYFLEKKKNQKEEIIKNLRNRVKNDLKNS